MLRGAGVALPPIGRRTAAWLVAVLVVAFAARIAVLVVVGEPASLSRDEVRYDAAARQLVDEGFLGYGATKPNADVTPGYPLFLAGVYRAATAFGPPETQGRAAVRLVQALFGVATVGMVWMLARRVSGRLSVAFVAAGAVAIDTSALMAQERILTEGLYAFGLVSWAYLLYLLVDRRTWLLHAASGAALGLLVLLRPVALPLVVVVYGIDFLMRRDSRFLRGAVLAVVACMLVLVPWWVRNAVVLGEFVPLNARAGDPILRGTDPYDPYDNEGPSVIESVPPAQMADVARERIAEGLRTDPVYWIGWFTVGKTWYMWRLPWAEGLGYSRIVHAVVVLILGGAGIAMAIRKHRLALLAAFPIAITLLQLPFIPLPRYVFPATPLMYVLAVIAAIGVAECLLEWRSRTGA